MPYSYPQEEPPSEHNPSYPNEQQESSFPQSSPYSGISPPSYDDRDRNEIGIIKEMSPRKVLEQLRMNIKGYYWDSDKKEYIKIPGMHPLMNDKGISKYLSIMSSVITDLVTFSNYKDSEINRLTEYICEKIIPTIHINYVEYGIQEKSDLPIIDVQIFNLTLASFKKAVGAGDRNLVRGVTTENISQRPSNYNEERRGGFFSKFNPFYR
jgi:hypothetical protein